ncbi:phenylacetate--CoA ligase family protein [Peribacillus alkalitolerans]|uniref:phenylacetate--CoA ligase family protein n=1 Tax=Peribacillus alkalitolerans TaxID=1550385 RepID=UPI0013D2E512|nr:AMP-binding protein [Peribacillus alkalitolerans]
MILHEEETYSREKMERLQFKRILATVNTVYEQVPFYRKQWNEAGIIPQDIQKLDDIKNLPFTTKKDLRGQYPFGLFAVEQSEVVRIHASSGTSGKPTVVGYTQKDIDMWGNLVARAISMAGGNKGEVLHNAYGYGLFTGGLGLHYGSEKLGMATVPVSGGNTDRQIALIQDFKPSVICGTPSYILTITERMEHMGIDLSENSLKFGIFGAEPWSEEMRALLEKKLGIKACDIYGLSEILGPGVSMECHEAQNGLHVAEDHFYVEVIDPITLLPLPDGEEGELVFTSLTKEALPIIRYRTGDIASLSREVCACGRTTTRMSRIKGRIDDMLIVRGVNVFPSEIEHYLLSSNEIVPHYQLHVKRIGTLDTVELHIEVKEDLFMELGKNLDHDQIQFLSREIQHTLKSHLLISIDVKVCPPKSIPRSEGKAVRILDHRKFSTTNP